MHCLLGCRCRRHVSYAKPCKPGCTCGKHVPWNKGVSGYTRRPHSKETKRKISARYAERLANGWVSPKKGRPGPPCSEAAKIKLSQSLRGKPKSAASRKNYSAASRRMWSDPDFRKRQLTMLRSRERTAKVSAGVQLAYFEGRMKLPSPRYQRVKYKDRLGRNLVLRSNCEAAVAEQFDKERLHWSYEPKCLRLSNGKAYFPDFWVEEWQEFVEVHPRRTSEDSKFAKVQQAVKDGYRVFLIDEPAKWIDSRRRIGAH